MTTKITSYNIADNSITVDKLAPSAVTSLYTAGDGITIEANGRISATAVGPTITGFTVQGTDDLALDPAGGQTVVIQGTRFQEGATVQVGANVISVVTFVDSNTLQFTSEARSSGLYTLFVINPDNSVAILTPGLPYSGFPTFTTESGSLGTYYETKEISETIEAAEANDTITYAVVSGQLPPGSNLLANGAIIGTAPIENASNTYSFTIAATDEENQSTTRSFSLTINADVVTWVSPSGATITLSGDEVMSNVVLSATSAAGYSVSYSANALPTNVFLSDDTIYGTPNTEQTISTVFTATAATTNRSATRTVNWVVLLTDPYFKETSLVINGDVNTFITDASDNNFTITPVADTRPSAFSPYNGGWSNYFDGSGDYLTGSSSMLGGGSVNTFTIEGWVYPTLFGAQRSIIGDMQPTGGGNYISADISSTGQVILYWYDGNSKTCTSTSTMSLNTWNYFAIRVSNNAISIYVNSETASGLTGTTTLTNRGGTLNFALGQWNNSLQFNGYISNIRVSTVARTILIPTEPFIPDADTRILTCQSNRFVDQSKNNFTLTNTGDVKVQSFGPFASDYRQDSTSYSVYFDGVDDYFYSTTPLLPSGSTNTFTIEGWFYTPSAPGSQYLIFADGNPTQNEFNIGVQLNSNRTLRFAWYTALQSPYGFDCATTGTANLNAWNWFAVVVNNNAISIYLNSTTPQGLTGTTTLINRGRIGYMMAGLYFSLLDYLGYISNIRVSTIARTITEVPTAPYEADANTRWLVAQSSTLIDNSGNNHNPIIAGNQCHIRTFNPFGYTNTPITDTTGSGYFDGTGDYLTVPDNDGLDLGNTDFTIDFWMYPTSVSNNAIVAGKHSNSNGSWLILRNGSVMKFYSSTDGTNWNITNGVTIGSIAIGQWYHIAVTREGSSFRCFLNGVIGSTTTSSSTIYNGTQVVVVGSNTNNNDPYAGYVSNFRIIKGTALYTANFVPPSAPLTSVTNTQLLTLQNRIGYNNSQPIDESGIKNVITRNGNASAGTFSPHVPTGWSGYFDGSGDYLSLADNTAFDIGLSGEPFTIESWYYPTTTTTNYQGICGRGGGYAGWNSTNGWQYSFFLFNNLIHFQHWNGSALANFSTSLTASSVANRWNHFVVSYDGSNLSIFRDGSRLATTTSSLGKPSSSTRTRIGGSVVDAETTSALGYLSNFRMVKGSAVYDPTQTTITVPTTPLEPIVGTSLLTLRGPTFTDDGPNRFAITRNGDTRITPFSPFKPHTITPDSYSVYFDGTGDMIETPSITIGTNAFCFECWLYPSVAQGSTAGIFVADTNGGLQCSYYGTNNGLGIANKGVAWQVNTNDNVVPTVGQWNHVAFVRSSTGANDTSIFLNGVRIANGTVAHSYVASTYEISTTNAGGVVFNGYISNARLTVGSTPYSASSTTITVPTAPLTAISGTSLLTCQSPTVIDNSDNDFAITVNGNSQPTKFNPFGETVTSGVEYSPASHGGSVYFDGSGDYLSFPADTAFIFGTGDFTTEAWIYPTTVSGSELVVLKIYGSVNTVVEMRQVNDTLQMTFRSSSGATSTLTSSAGSIVANQWHHIAFVRQSGTLRAFLNGVQYTTATNANTQTDTSLTNRIGSNQTGTGVFNGYISNLRIAKGTALYTSAFVPPQAPVDPIPGTTLLTCDNNAAIQDKTGRNVLETVGNARVVNGVKKYGSGAMYFDGTGDYLVGPSTSETWIGRTGDFTAECWIYTTSSSNQTLFIINGNSSSYGACRVGLNTNKIYLLVSTTGSSWQINSGDIGTINSNEWYHIAAVRNGNNFTLYVNGTSIYNSTSVISTTQLMTGTYNWVGAIFNSGVNNPFNGYIDDLRITKGVARYEENFEPPTKTYKLF